MNVIHLFFATIIFRPYVFIFLAMYLVAAYLKVGAKKAALFTLSAWAIAYVSEFSSIRNGIPFGLYHYIPSTVDRELWIFGVPFMDSLSFTFLAYSSWATARVFMSPAEGKGMGYRLVESPHPCIPSPLRGNYHYPSPPVGEGSPKGRVGAGRGTKGEGDKGYYNRFSIGTVFLGALLFMLIDVVIDPLSLRGDRWFLGKIYYYPDGGAYFGVTISNFIGWFIVGFVTLMVWGVIDRLLPSSSVDSSLFPSPYVDSSLYPSPTCGRGWRVTPGEGCGRGWRDAPGEGGFFVGAVPSCRPSLGWKRYVPSVDLLGPALYMIVLVFNLTMTFYIGEMTIGWVGVFIFLPVVFLMGQKIKG